jgi:hypothetical protein
MAKAKGRSMGRRLIAVTAAILAAASPGWLAGQPGSPLPDEKKSTQPNPGRRPPVPDAETKRRHAEWKRLDDEAWRKAEAGVLRQAKAGKPYLPQAERPEDLPQARIPAFPGAEGAGRFSFGGRGGKVYVVTSLADSGPGTFREACEAAGPRIVVFNVAGIIRLQRPLHIRAPYITIAGQSAPGDGVCVAGFTTHVDTHDVVIRYMRFRRGATDVFDRDDALGGNPVGNIVIDHCSCSWGLDENISFYRHMYLPPGGGPARKLPTVNLTIQWIISSEALDTYGHAFGATWGGRNTSFHHNLFACNTGRNPSIGMSYDFNFLDNTLFNWRHRTVDGGDETSRGNVINNTYKPGPATREGPIRYRVVLPDGKRFPKGATNVEPDYGRWYVAGNHVVGNAEVTADNWAGGVQFRASGTVEAAQVRTAAQLPAPLLARTRATQPLPMAPVTLQPAPEAYEAVLAGAGAALPRRDPVDERIIRAVRTGQVSHEAGQGIITAIKQVGGYPAYRGQPVVDSDGDGIPDWWERKYGLNPHDPADAVKDGGSGYSYIEMYLNGIDPTRRLDFTDPKNNVDTLTREKLLPPATK